MLILAILGVMFGFWCVLFENLWQLPSEISKSKPLVQPPEHGLVKQWDKEKPGPLDHAAPSQERPTHIQRFRNNRRALDKSNDLSHNVRVHEKH